MGILQDIGRDIRMGFDRSARDKDYYDRTARTMARTQGQERADRYRAQTADLRAAAPAQAPAAGGGLFGGGSGGGRNVFAQQPRTRTPDADYNLLRDMFDGGGMGYSGPAFRGGLASIGLNLAGVRPMGSDQANPYGLLNRVTGETAKSVAQRRAAPQAMGAPAATPLPQMRSQGLLPTMSYQPPAPVMATELPPSEIAAATDALAALSGQDRQMEIDAALPSYYDATIPRSETASPPLSFEEFKAEVAKRADINRYPDDILRIGYQDYAAMQGIDPRSVR